MLCTTSISSPLNCIGLAAGLPVVMDGALRVGGALGGTPRY
jgi:hypothetical protein